MPLQYFNAPLSPTQSLWAPYEQEFWGLVQFKCAVVAAFGRIPLVIHTDHANLTRFEYLALERIDAKHYRWHSELVQGGCLLLYRPGTGALHRLPDALSRNPEVRDILNLARIGDWTKQRNVIKGVQDTIAAGNFDEDPPPHVFDISELGKPISF